MLRKASVFVISTEASRPSGEIPLNLLIRTERDSSTPLRSGRNDNKI